MTVLPDSNIRYDRQVRLWGEDGQASIGATSVCVIGCDSLGTELLKSLVLAGVHSFLTIDDRRVEPADLGQNFFLTGQDIGSYRSEAALGKLMELNPSVSGGFSTDGAEDLLNSPEHLSKFSVVVAANQTEEVERGLSRCLFELGVPFICVRSYGLLGAIKICIKEHTIVNSHEENPRPDLRLDVPFPELADLVQNIDLNTLTIDELRHTPYLLLHFKALEEFRNRRSSQNAFPQNYSERKEIQEILKGFRRSKEESGTKDSENFDEAKAAVNRAFQKTTLQIGNCVKSILTDERCATSTQPFWIICEALRQFVVLHDGLLPLRGTLPDMTSDTNSYTRLSTLFHEKALSDAQEVLQLTRAIEKERGVGDLISDEMCYRFCKNADRIRVQRGELLDFHSEMRSIVQKVREQDAEEGRIGNATWILLLRSVEKFRKEKGRFPGTNGVPVSIEWMDLKKRVESLVRDALQSEEHVAEVVSRVPDTAIAEMCRFGAAELHVISSYIGGIAAQEVIKLATNQYVPLDNTFVFDGHTQQSDTFKL